MINDRDNKIKRLNGDNDLIKSENINLNNNVNELDSQIEEYKKHILVVTEQNDKLSQELEAIVSRDSQLTYTLGRAEHLKAIEQENKSIINNSLESLKQHLENHGNMRNKSGDNTLNNSFNNKTYISKYNANVNDNLINNENNINLPSTSMRNRMQNSSSLHNSQEMLNSQQLQNIDESGNYSGNDENQQYFGNKDSNNQYSGGEEEQQYSGGEEEQQYSGAEEEQHYSDGEEEQQQSGGEEEQQYSAGEEPEHDGGENQQKYKYNGKHINHSCLYKDNGREDKRKWKVMLTIGIDPYGVSIQQEQTPNNSTE